MTQEKQLKADMRTWHEMAKEAAQNKLKDFQAALEQSRMQTSDDTLWSDETETINMPDLLQKKAYNEYKILCKNGEVEPMAYEQWAEWDRDVYQKHVREAANPLTPDTFQRMQEADLTEGKEVEELRDMYRGIVEENESLVVDLAVADQNIDALVKERDTYRSMANELNTVVGDLRLRETETTQFKILAEAETTRIGRLNGELRTQLEAKDKEVAGLVDECNKLAEQVVTLSVDKQLLSNELTQKDDQINLGYRELEKVKKNLQFLHEESQNLWSFTTIRTTPANQPLFPHYFKEVPNSTHVDIYWVLKAWEVVDPCVQHAVKKLMAAGIRGAKNRDKDLTEARDSISRAIELEQTK